LKNMSAKSKYRIGIIGAGECPRDIEQIAENVGKQIGDRGAILVCGGMGGVMEAAARGAHEAGGTTVGILPGFDVQDANPYIDIPIVTGMSEARNIIIVRSSDAVIAVSGGHGTLSEIAFCLKLGVPLIGIQSWNVDSALQSVDTPEEAVDLAFRLIENRTLR